MKYDFKRKQAALDRFAPGREKMLTNAKQVRRYIAVD